MHYQKIKPSPSLEEFVECYYIWEGEVDKPLDVQSPPNCFTAIVFNYGDPCETYQNNSGRQPVPLAFACGLFTSNYHLVLNGKIGMIGIVLKPCGFHNLFDMRMSHLVNNRMPLELLIGPESQRVLDEIKAAPDNETRLKIAEQLLTPRIDVAKSRRTIVDDAENYIDGCNGNVQMEDVAAKLKISRRYLEKSFIVKVGVSPKFYARLKRFAVLSNMMVGKEKVDWRDLAFESGLYDHSHLVKEYLKFNGQNPDDYRQNHQELIRFVKKG